MATKLGAEKREQPRKSVTRKLRKQGKIPAILYGEKTDNQTVSVEENELSKVFRSHGRNGVINLSVNGQAPVSVMAHDIQIDHLRDEILHVDFLAVDMDAEMDTEVSIHTKGEAKGEKEGGVVQHVANEVTVRAKPEQIPSVIEVDISNLDIGDALKVGDIEGNDHYEVLDDAEEVLISIIPPGTSGEAEEEKPESEDLAAEVIQEKGDEVPGNSDTGEPDK